MDDFREYLAGLGLSARSIQLYAREAARAQAWLTSEGTDLLTAPPTLLAAYCDTFPRTCSSRKMLRSTFSHYWRFVSRPDPPTDAIRVPPRRRMVCRAVEEDDARILAKVAQSEGGHRGLALGFALFMGLRREEISRLAWSGFSGGWLTLTGKGDVTDAIPIHSTVVEMLERYPRAGTWVFPGRFGGPCNPATIWHWIKTLAEEAGVKDFTPHRGRHTALATANDNSGDLRTVQAIARHAQIQTTSGYTRATGRKMREVMEAIRYD